MYRTDTTHSRTPGSSIILLRSKYSFGLNLSFEIQFELNLCPLLEKKIFVQLRNGVFATNWNSLSPIYLQPLIFQTYIIWFNIFHSLKYLRSTTLCSKDIGISNMSLWQGLNFFILKVMIAFIVHGPISFLDLYTR